jgi:hypothetical protein
MENKSELISNEEKDRILDETLKKIEEIEKDKNFKEPKMSEEDKKMIIDAIDERIQEIESTYDKND